MGNMPGGQVSTDSLVWMRGDGRVGDELVVYVESCGPDSALLVEVAGSCSAAASILPANVLARRA